MRSVPGADRGSRAGSPRGVVIATGSKLNLKFGRILNDSNYDPLNLGPVATAPVSDIGRVEALLR